jgi:capsule polysaccharide export protein KpsE/RkpR
VRFEATARVMPPDSGNGSLAALSMMADKAGVLGGFAGDLLGVKNSSDLLVGILTSNTLQDRLISRFELKKVYGLTYQEDLRTRLMDNTAISVDRKSGILSITVTDRKRDRAAAIANAYVDELNTLSAELSTSSARREREFLEGRLRQVSQDLEQAEKNLSQFSSKNATLNPQEQGKAMVDAAAQLQGRLIAAQATLEGIRTIYSDNSSRVRAVKAEIAQLQHDIAAMGGKAGSDAETGPDQLYPTIRQLPLLGVAWADLYREAKVQEAVFEILTKQYELAKVQEAKEIPSIKVLDNAAVPQKKSFPPRTTITIIGTFFTFMFAVVWTLGSALWKTIDPASEEKILATRIWKSITSPARKVFHSTKWGRSIGAIRSEKELQNNKS